MNKITNFCKNILTAISAISIFLLSVNLASASVIDDIGKLECDASVNYPNLAPPHTKYLLNVGHIFCGNVHIDDDAEPIGSGFHVMYDDDLPETVDLGDQKPKYPINKDFPEYSRFTIFQRVTEAFRAKPVPGIKQKSTLFPTYCSREQVVNSILYSVRHDQCKKGSAYYGLSGPGGPFAASNDYCYSNEEQAPFYIKGWASDNMIKTGFPLKIIAKDDDPEFGCDKF
jgi:hypothetical protein